MNQTESKRKSNKTEEMTKEKRISLELKRLNTFFEHIDTNQREFIIPLLQNCAFMKATLEDLQAKINSDGVTEKYQNGSNQFGIKQSATLQSYNTLVKNYAAVMNKLIGLLPPEERPDKLTEFMKAE